MTNPSADPRPDWPDRYTGWDFLMDSLDQVRQMEAARREWYERFEKDQKRIDEWVICDKAV
jgi:hypothetical protein